MMESSQKKTEVTETLPDDLVNHIMSVYLPIRSVLRNRSASKKFKDLEIWSRDLDFSGIYSVRCIQRKAVRIIENVFNEHKVSEINRFVLLLNHIGVEDKILSWINTCLGKNIQELVLDFSKSRKVANIPVDFSGIEALTVLKLGWCRFKIPDNSLKGLKLLKTLSLTKTGDMNTDMINAIFSNCIHLETFELINFQMFGTLSINAVNHKKFKSLVVYTMPYLLQIIVDAPTPECFKYDGYCKRVYFSRVHTLKEANLHYNRSLYWRYYDPSERVLANMGAYIRVRVLATNNIFLEAFTYKYDEGEMKKPNFCFWSLQEFQISFKAPTICNLFDIAQFLEQCPNLKKVLIDINDFTFEPGVYWEVHQKQHIRLHNYRLNSIKFVEIMGYKNHWHELDIMDFFVRYAISLEKLTLTKPRNPKIKLFEPDNAKINYIKSMSQKKDLIEFI
ncbi:hypothetical protein EUTSA_v10023885mg [Eutrema salsugineum]|uniref:At1g61320/AtMIF1 LRR domain-containing protein n=1 Tax=Eutrema salsugineum TaxID=72664 RepID=V4KDU1_EUTSA|nr:FBD-associated F-box protein At1g61320 [Eutrema salsugineum]ESQ29304.1 hypothetical protein EUTSA_v10023885mg [Eutrema salsugineum]